LQVVPSLPADAETWSETGQGALENRWFLWEILREILWEFFMGKSMAIKNRKTAKKIR
jgi:hypothetical protein